MIKDWLFINPVTSQPKMIDVTRAYNYTNFPAWDSTKGDYVYGDRVTFFGGLFVVIATPTAGQSPSTHPTKWRRIGDSYQSESSTIGDELSVAFNMIKTPPIDVIKTAFGSDPSVSSNQVKGRVFRFCHRYQYFDDSYSVYSAYTGLSLPVDDELYSGEIIYSTTFNNYIALTFSLYSASLVKNIELFFQELEGSWYRLAVIKRQDQTLLDDVNYTHNFYNNESYIAVPNSEVVKVQDAVPREAGSLEIINENILTLGKCTEGFDNLEKDVIDVTLTPEIKDIKQFTQEDTFKRNNIPGDLSYSNSYDEQLGVNFYYTILDVGTWFAGSGIIATDVYKATLDGLTQYKTLGAGDVDTAEHLANAIASLFQNATVYNGGGGIVNVQILDYYKFPELTLSRFYSPDALVTGTTTLTKFKGVKEGAYHPYCLFYYDGQMRRSSAQVNNDLVVYVPSVNEYSPPVTTTNHKWDINWAVNHEPPTWAKYWRWGYAGNRRCSYFVQYIILKVANSVVAPDTPDVNNTVKVDITPLQTLRTTAETGWNCFPNSIIPQYQFTEGDRIRFMTEETDPTIAGTLLGDVLNGIYDFEILKFDEPTNMLYIQSFDFGTAKIGVNSLVEIYTPRKTTEVEFYYEFGDLLPIVTDINGKSAHGAINSANNQVVGVSPATGVFENGDIYHIYRTPSKPLSEDPSETFMGAFHESMWWSDFYKSDEWNRGKIGIENPIGEVTTNLVRYSNPYFQGTQINGLTTFEEESKKEINDVFGDIQALVEVGDTLKVYQTKKASAILIGKTEYTDSSGQATTPELTTRTLGSIRYPESNYGTIFPESIVKNNRYVYGFDVHNGVVWRDSPSGIFPISGRFAEAGGDVDYKMQTYFKNKSKALMESGVDHIKCIGVWDGENKMYVLSIKDTVNEVNNDTIMFHEPSNRWITNADFTKTPDGGYNQLLELTWEVVKGFENGIGLSFDYATRFAVFDIGSGLGTSANASVVPPTDGMGIRTYIPLPTISCTAGIVPDEIAMLMTIPDPTIHISSLSVSEDTMLWDADQSGVGDKINTALSSVNSPYVATTFILESKPSWITILEEGRAIFINNGDTVSLSTNLWVYPTLDNTGSQRVGQIIFKDGFGNRAVVYCTQQIALVNPIVILAINPADTSDLGLGMGSSGSNSVGTTRVNLIDLNLYNPGRVNGATFEVFYAITRDGVNDATGSFDYRNGVTTTTYVLLNSISTSGEEIKVFFSSASHSIPIDPVNASVLADPINMVITIPKPTIVVSWINFSVTTMTWPASNNSYASKQTSVASFHTTVSAFLQSFPSWITIINESHGGMMYVGDMVRDSDILSIYPNVINSLYTPKIGVINFTDSTGNSININVTHQATLLPPSVTVQMNPSDHSGTTLSGVSGSGSAGSNNISITFTPNYPHVAYGRPLDFNYQIWKNDVPVGSGNLFSILNQISNTKALTMTSPAEAGQTIIVYLNEPI